jgi:short-subunit dehydrogenase
MAALERAAQAAKEAFGRFDTWVNNAGVSIYGKMLDVPIEDMQRLFETNFWGVVYGSLVAAKHLKTSGGALINVGSVLSDRAIPIQGIYSASKHAVKGFTDALRMEMEAEALPISITLIKPSAINTPYTEHAKNYMPNEPSVPPPVYSPDLVAEAILYCAENQTRDFTVGEGGKMISLMGTYAPRLMDLAMEWTMPNGQQKSEPNTRYGKDTGLAETQSDLRERGNYNGVVFEESLYHRARMNPLITGAVLLGGSLALATWLNSKSKIVGRTSNYMADENELPNSQQRSLEVGHS